MKKLSFFLMAMLFSVMSFAETYSLTPNKAQTGLTNTSYITTLTSFTYNGVTWKMNQWNPSTLQVKTNQSSAASEWRFYNETAMPGKITKVVIKFSALTLKNTTTTGFKFVGGSSAVTGTTGGTDGVWNATAKTLTWTPGESDNFTFFALYQNGKVASGTNNLATSDAIVVTYEAEGGSTETIVKTLKSISVEGMTTTFEQGDIFKFDGTCTATYSVTKNDEPQADETKTVTPAVSVPDMNLLGTQTVTVSYTDDEETVSTTYDINIIENTVTPGTYTGNLNNTFFGCAAGNNGAELSGKFNDILVVSSCKSNAQNKTYYDAAHVRFYADTYLKISVPEGYAITSIQLKEPTSSTKWDGSISVNKGTYTEGTKSWSGYEQEVQFSFGKQNRIASISVTYELLDVKHIAVPVIFGDAEFVESTEVSISAEEGLKVYYTLDGTDPTNASTEYTAPFSVTATTTVKAVAYDGENASDIASQTFKKLQALTCEEAADACTSTESADKYVIRGYVTNVKYAYNDEYKTATFWIADSKDGGQVLQAYSAKPVAEIDKAVKVGDYVETIGNLKLYNTTPEITNGTYTIIPAPVVNHTVTVTANAEGENVVTGAGEYEEGEEVTVTASEDLEGWVFIGWTEDGEFVANDPEYTFVVKGDVELVAVYAMDLGENEVTDLVIDGDNMLLTGSVAGFPMGTMNLELALGEYDDEEGVFLLTEESKLYVGETNFTFVDGMATVDMNTNSAMAIVVFEHNGAYYYMTVNMSKKIEATVIEINNATVTIEERSMGFGDEVYHVLKMESTWSDGETTYPVLLETTEFDQTKESQEVAASITVGGMGDEDPWLGNAEGDVTITVADGKVTVEGLLENAYAWPAPVAFDVTISGTLPVKEEPKTITWELNGGEVAAVVPTNEELWIAFMPYYQEYYDVVRAEQPIASVAVFLSAGMGDDATIFTSEDSDYKWLGDYIIKVTTEQSAALTTLANWKFNAQAFFNANQYTGWPKSADFTEAGKPENWGPAYQAAHEVVLPTEPVAEDYVLPTPVKEGYTFVGWYDNAEGTGEAMTVLPAGWAGTLYAIWKTNGPTTDLDNIAVEGKAVKAIINGQLIIIKNGVQYNAQGAVVK